MTALALQAAGGLCLIGGFILLAPFAGLLAAGALLIAFGIAIERSN